MKKRAAPASRSSAAGHLAPKAQGAAPPLTRTARKSAAPPPPEANAPGQPVELLKALHILTRDGRLNQDSARKLKQVDHLVQFIAPLLAELKPHGAEPTLADHGAGKSYLGFILYDRLLKPTGHGQVWGIETRAELVQSARALAAQLGFERMHFLHMAAADAAQVQQLPARVDVVTALHACDTATDDAIAFGLQKNAQAMVLVPCCQAELAARLRQTKALQLARTPLAELWRHPLHTREMGSQLTNVLRCLYLQSQGYSVTVTELVGWEHSLKNELIIARYTGQRSRSAGQRLISLLGEFGLTALLPTRYAALASQLADEAGGTNAPGMPERFAAHQLSEGVEADGDVEAGGAQA